MVNAESLDYGASLGALDLEATRKGRAGSVRWVVRWVAMYRQGGEHGAAYRGGQMWRGGRQP